MPKFYINTAIAYVNAPPHLGHALEFIGADVIARHHRLLGDEVLLGTGTDEHGVKLANTAKKLGMEPQALCDQNAAKFAALKEQLNYSYDIFWRTTDPKHQAAAVKVWQKMAAAGDIYQKTYQGLYCVGCETFKTKSELVEGKCPDHNAVPQLVDEENYFFRLSKYGPAIQKHFEEHPDFVRPQKRYNEIYNVVKAGLEDISISRHVSKLSWGVPVPGDSEQVMYVWVEALSSYINMVGYGWDEELLRKWWPTDVNIIGKDIIRHHAAIWPGILMSFGQALPRQIFAHGFITSGGRKMSKTLGNVIDPLAIKDLFGVDACRYLLLRIVPFDDDGDVTLLGLGERYVADLANNLGNLVNRVLKMCERYGVAGGGSASSASEASASGSVLSAPDANWPERVSRTWKKYNSSMAEFRFHLALEAVMECVSELNAAIEQEKPWDLAKRDEQRLSQVLFALLESLRHVALWLAPFMPAAAKKLYAALGLKLREQYSAAAYEQRQQWLGEKLGKKLVVIEPLFPRLEEE